MKGDRIAVRLKDPPTEPCCKCGKPHSSGIYIRGNEKDFFYCVHKEQ